MIRRRRVFVSVAIVLSLGVLNGTSSLGADAEGRLSSGIPGEMRGLLGEGVVGDALSASPLIDPARIAQWTPGEWRYRITAGARRGQAEQENLAFVSETDQSELWSRTVGQEYTLHVSRIPEGTLVLPSEIAHAHDVLVRFEPPLTYLMAGLEQGERKVFDGTMNVYSSRRPTVRLYRGKIRATTVYAGVYQVTTPAGTFPAAAIRTDYEIDILTVVSVRDTLYTFYVEGVGKVAEAERRRVATGPFKSDTGTGKILVSFRPVGPFLQAEAP